MKMTRLDLRNLIMEVLNEADPLSPATPTPVPNSPAAQAVPPLDSNISVKIQDIFSSFERQLNASENVITKKKEAELEKLLKGKMIRTRASIGYKNVEKEYEINVKEVHLIFYYEEYVVSITGAEKNAKKDREYILNKALDVEIVTPEVTQPSVSKPSVAPTPKPTNPASKPTGQSAPAPSLSSQPKPMTPSGL
jgi:hypothetical protein